MRCEWVLDRASFFAEAEPFFMRDETLATIPLTVITSLRALPEVPSDVEMWRVEDAGETVAFALRTPPFPLVVALGTPAAMEELARTRAAAEAANMVAHLPSFAGPAELSSSFARTFALASGREVQAEKCLRLYVNDRVIPPARPAPGAFRRAEARDVDKLADYYEAFGRDVATPLRAARVAIADGLKYGRLHVWELGDDLVSIAQQSPRAGSTVRVNLVYTPPHARGKGYASSCVAALTAKIHDEGARACLFTNLDNATSNAIYQAIGYRPVSDYREIAFA